MRASWPDSAKFTFSIVARDGYECLKKTLFNALKLVIPACLFIYLLWQVDAEDYRTFWNQPKRWDLLVLAQCTALIALVISFLRWRMLVLAFQIPFTVREAMRLGFLGYLLNFVSFGSVGGDLFKAILVARDKPTRRPEAIASVLLDRAIGLLGLVILAWLSLTLLADPASLTPVLIGIGRAAGFVAFVSVAGLLLAVFAGNWFDRLIEWGHPKIPLAGESLARMARAFRLLRTQPAILFSLVVISVGVHSLLATTVFLVSCGTYREQPSLSEHFMVVPPAMAAGALPLAPGGLGYQEGALAGLFEQLPDLPESFSGILVATIYRLITIAIAGIGLIYYWASHGREFQFVRSSDRAGE